jgi:uncharacterized membrane protein (DUF485 family)
MPHAMGLPSEELLWRSSVCKLSRHCLRLFDLTHRGGRLLVIGSEENRMSEAARRYEADKTEWDRIAETREFKDLLAIKKTFIVPAFVFFIVYYFLLPILVGYAPGFMSTKVFGVVNLAYLFALSQFFMAWTVAYLYVKAANNFDRLAKDIIKEAESQAQKGQETR